MKDFFVKSMAMMLALVLSLTFLTSCGSKDKPSSSDSNAQSDSDNNISSDIKDDSNDESNNSSSGGSVLTQESILNYPETSMDEFHWEEYDGKIAIDGCESKSDVIVVPAEYQGLPVVYIDAHGLAGLDTRAIVLPDSITTIGEDAFGFCENLEYIHLGSGLKTLGNLAFGGCKSLKQVIIPKGTETIEGPLLIENTQLERVVIPDSVVNLPSSFGVADTCPNAVIVTEKGSNAEQIAISSGFRVEYVSE